MGQGSVCADAQPSQMRRRNSTLRYLALEWGDMVTNKSPAGGPYDRLLREPQIAELVPLLITGLPGTDLQSLMLHVYRQRASALRPADVFRQYQQDRFVCPAHADPVEANRLDGVAFGLLPRGFTPMELAPVAPLGACSALGPVDQNNVLTTVRNTEVVSDPTNLLALECAKRRRASQGASPVAEVKLCASHRVIRAQPFSGPSSFSHFRALCLCTAGRDAGGFLFETRNMVAHIDYYLRLLEHLREIGYPLRVIRVTLLPLSSTPPDAIDRIQAQLAVSRPQMRVEVKPDSAEAGDYYRAVRFNSKRQNNHPPPRRGRLGGRGGSRSDQVTGFEVE